MVSRLAMRHLKFDGDNRRQTGKKIHPTTTKKIRKMAIAVDFWMALFLEYAAKESSFSFRDSNERNKNLFLICSECMIVKDLY
jgi:hypothetical protein